MDNDTIETPVAGISACFPAMNDEFTIGKLITTTEQALREITSDYEIIIVNDGSTDRTQDVLLAACAEIPQLRVIHHAVNLGYGAALRAAISKATKPWVFYTDGDGQYDPSELKLLALKATSSVDIVNGYKTYRRDSITRRLAGTIWRYVARVFFGIRIRDVDCDFRLFRRSLIHPEEMTSQSGGWSLEFVLHLQQKGARFVEIPVNHFPRVFGRSQFFQFHSLWGTAREVFMIWWTLRFHSRASRGKAG
jgi:glycosyltransferase involved in cell wall biosynthesis